MNLFPAIRDLNPMAMNLIPSIEDKGSLITNLVLFMNLILTIELPTAQYPQRID